LLPAPFRLFSSRRHDSILGPDITLVSLDIFGLALRRMILAPDDIHLLVDTFLQRHHNTKIEDYVELRHEAERRTRVQLGSGVGVGVADIAVELERLLTERHERSSLDPATVAGEAIRCELEIEQLICRRDPETAELYTEAVHRGIDVAFVADSTLPRDLVTRMLTDFHYRSDNVLVSSHEGRTLSTGLLDVLLERTGTEARQAVHVGPDEETAVAGAAMSGVKGCLVPPPREQVEDQVVLGATKRTGLDSIGLALAADRLMKAGPNVTAADVGYYAAGPLVCGFATWVGQLIDDIDPDHVVFYGPTVGFISRLAIELKPELAGARLTRFDPSIMPPSDRSPGPATLLDQIFGFCDKIGVGNDDHILAVDLGWNERKINGLGSAWDLVARHRKVSHAFVGSCDDQHPAESVHSWAFGPKCDNLISESANERPELFEALFSYAEGGPGSALTQFPRQDREAFENGIASYVTDFEPWVRLGGHVVSAAMAEPAIRLVRRPTYAEARVLADVPSKISDDSGLRRPLVDLPQQNGSTPTPQPTEIGASDAIWWQGYEALLAGDPAAEPARTGRRLGRRA